MFEGGSLWKPPPLKNLRSKVLPPIEGEIVKKGQLSSKLENAVCIRIYGFAAVMMQVFVRMYIGGVMNLKTNYGIYPWKEKRLKTQ